MFGFGSRDKHRDWDTVLNAANEARDNGQWLQAAAGYQTAVTIEEDRADIWVQFAHSLKEFGAFGEAVNAYRQAIKIQPGDAEVHVHLAHVLKRTGSYSAAKSEFERAIHLDPLDNESVSELDRLEEMAQAEAEASAVNANVESNTNASQAQAMVEVDEGGAIAFDQTLFREFEVSASHFVQEGALKALNNKLIADIDVLKLQIEGLQRELRKQAVARPAARKRGSAQSSTSKKQKA